MAKTDEDTSSSASGLHYTLWKAIAEDDELILKTIEHKLVKEGYEVILTRNGKDAIETFL